MKHLDLFSGIGGFALAADRVFGEVEHTFVEYDPFCQAILRKHFPNSEIYGDIRNFATDTEREGRERELRGTEGQHRLRGGSREDEKPFLLTGGFPCQPFSHAGRRKGTADDRYLWPEMFRVIRATQPTWVIAENVRGLVTWNDGMVLETVCSDLEGEGYEVQPLIIPAVAVGAPHRRDRVWIIANLRSEESRGVPSVEREEVSEIGKSNTELTSNPRQQLREQGSGEGVETNQTIGATRTEADKREHQYTWADDWREVALATCNDRVDARISPWLDYFLGRLKYATSYKNIGGQDLSSLQEKIQQEEIQWPTGGCNEVPTKDFLLRTLRWFQRFGEISWGLLQPESIEIPEGEVRKVQDEVDAYRTSQGREQVEQRRKELADALPFVPLEVALEVEEIWNCVRILQTRFKNIGIIVLPDGTSITESKYRQEALKAYGNAIVPQVAMEIMKAIKNL